MKLIKKVAVLVKTMIKYEVAWVVRKLRKNEETFNITSRVVSPWDVPSEIRKLGV